ncbi:unnamed protein product [Ambrosiozyma monospora]|uniref:Unnamed protein product n=1 Tax=Ambrosiozyma monospora TaxID=43982 RepID=A0ACB5SSX4_AMBMO|nr:unnamed protein product [Ambrosiozyma monospora]
MPPKHPPPGPPPKSKRINGEPPTKKPKNGSHGTPPPPPPPGMRARPTSHQPPPPPPPGMRSRPPPPPPSSKNRRGPPPPPPPPGMKGNPASQQHHAPQLSEKELQIRSQQWLQLQKKRFCESKVQKGTFVHSSKIEMPPEHLRKIMNDQGDLSSKKFTQEKRSILGSLKYMPHAILKLLESMPQPWEQTKEVKVL